MPWSTETKMNVEWIDPGLLRDFQAEGTDAYRLCTIEDGWVERFGSDVLLSFKRVLARERLLEELQTWADWVDVHVRRVFARFIPRENERREPPALVVGDPAESLQTVATEWSLRCGLDFGTGYSPGLFLDQRENRRYVRHIAPRRLLNCFAYTCSFSVCAACNGASTVNIDLSKKSLTRRGEKFDAIILDPPTFSRSPGGRTFQVQHDFESLLISALAVAERDAHVLVATNCSALGERALEVMARYCLKETRRAGTFHRPLPLPDFPARTGASSVWLALR